MLPSTFDADNEGTTRHKAQGAWKEQRRNEGSLCCRVRRQFNASFLPVPVPVSSYQFPSSLSAYASVSQCCPDAAANVVSNMAP